MNKGILAFIGILLVVTAGLVGYDAVLTSGLRSSVDTYLGDSETLAKKGEFAAAAKRAGKARNLLKTNHSLFSGEALEKREATIKRCRQEAAISARAKKIVKDNKLVIQKRLAILNEQLPEDIVKKSSALTAFVNQCRYEAVARELSLVLKGKRTVAAKLARADTLAALLSASEDRKRHTKLAKTITGFVKAETQKQIKSVHEYFRKVAKMLKEKEYAKVLDATPREEARLAAFPPVLTKALSAEREKIFAALKNKDKSLEKTLNLKAADQTNLQHFYAVATYLDSARVIAQTAATDWARARTKLKEIESTLNAGGNFDPELLALGEERVADYLREVKNFQNRYLSSRSRAMEQPPKAPAVMGNMIILTAAASPRVHLQIEDISDSYFPIKGKLTLDGVPIHLEVSQKNAWSRIDIETQGYVFSIDWPKSWWRGLYGDCLNAAYLARQMKNAGVRPSLQKRWRIVSTPWFPIAQQKGKNGTICFVEGERVPLVKMEVKGTQAVKHFVKTARAMTKTILQDEKIPADLRLTLKPVLEGTYGKIDKRDELEDEFCRRVVTDDYVEQYATTMSKKSRDALNAFHKALKPLGLAYPIFSFTLSDGRTFVAMRPLKKAVEKLFAESGEASANDNKKKKNVAKGGAKGKEIEAFRWRLIDDTAKTTAFAVPLLNERLYQLSIFAGIHSKQPAKQTPILYTVRQTSEGVVASYKPGAKKLAVNDADWRAAIATSQAPYGRAMYGKPLWRFPPHLPIYDSRGRIRALVTRQGELQSPNFHEIADLKKRHAMQAKYLTRCANTLLAPGELNLFYKYFSQYCFDSPALDNPRLIGSHLASGENHKTAYQFLDYKLGGRFVGDCDDLAEFFQQVTRRQGKESFMFALPSHAACGYIERVPKGAPADTSGKNSDSKNGLTDDDLEYTLTFLQTGPPLIFRAPTLDKVAERGVMFFNQETQNAFSAAAMHFMFRFSGEQTRQTYSLSDRILVDPEYAKTLIAVQGMWHSYYYSTAIRTMKKRLKIDRDISNFTELGGLYRAVGLFDKAAELSRKALANNDRKNDLRVVLEEKNTLATMLHRAGRDREAFMVNAEVTRVMQGLWFGGKRREYMMLASFRFAQAGLLNSMDRPFQAAQVLQKELGYTAMGRKVPLQWLGAVANIYSTIRAMERAGYVFGSRQQQLIALLETALKKQFRDNLFKPKDGFMERLRNYSLLGGFAFGQMDWDAARAKLILPNAYPDPQKSVENTARGLAITARDWRWFRLIPSLYLPFILEVTNLEDPDKFAPKKALPIIDAMLKGAEYGRQFGSMSMMEAALVHGHILRAIINNDLEEFRTYMKTVKALKSSMKDNWVATSFGQLLGLIPLKDVPKWMEVFHENITAKQHYFKVAYFAMNNNHIEHALAAAKAAVGYFPEIPAMAQEFGYMKKLAVTLRKTRDRKRKVIASKRAWLKRMGEVRVAVAKKAWALGVNAAEKARTAAEGMGDEGLEQQIIALSASQQLNKRLKQEDAAKKATQAITALKKKIKMLNKKLAAKGK